MRIEDFRRIQAESGPGFLSQFLYNCRDAYLAAARLVGLDSEKVHRVREQREVSDAAVWALMPAFEWVCNKYREEHFSAQENLFPDPSREAEAIWRAYLWQNLMPAMLAEPVFVRESLRAAGYLPAENRISVMKALVVLMQELSIRPPTVMERRGCSQE